MCATAFTTSFVSAVNSFAGTAFKLGVKLFLRQQSPGRIILSVATLICQEGIKLRVNAWVTKQRERRVGSLCNSFWWTKKKSQPESQYTNFVGVKGEIVATDAAFKFQRLAEQRLKRARASLKAAEIELREAERGLEEAKKYVRCVQSHCKMIDNSQRNIDPDIVFVEHLVE
ncbi:hypothetical protein ACHAW6_013481 [Cyclotella cf. meneghiniana]